MINIGKYQPFEDLFFLFHSYLSFFDSNVLDEFEQCDLESHHILSN